MPDACSDAVRVLRDTFRWPSGTVFVDRCAAAGYTKTDALVRLWAGESFPHAAAGADGINGSGNVAGPQVMLLPASATLEEILPLTAVAQNSVVIAVADGVDGSWGAIQDIDIIDFFVSGAGVARCSAGRLRTMQPCEAGELALALLNRRAGLAIDPASAYTSPPCYAGELREPPPGCRSGDEPVPDEDQMNLP